LTDYEVADAAVAAVVGDFYNKRGKINGYISAQKHPCADAIAAVQASLDKVSYFAPAVELVRAFASEFSIGAEPDGYLALAEHLAAHRAIIAEGFRAGRGQTLLDPQPVFAEWVREIAQSIVTKLGTPSEDFAKLPLEQRLLALALPIYDLHDKVLAQSFPEKKAEERYPDDVARYSLTLCVQPILAAVASHYNWLPETARELNRLVDSFNAMNTRPRYTCQSAPSGFGLAIRKLAPLRAICAQAVEQVPRKETLTGVRDCLRATPGINPASTPFKEQYLPAAKIFVILSGGDTQTSSPTVLFDGVTRTAAVVCVRQDGSEVALDHLCICRDGSLGNFPSGVLYPELTSELYREARRLAQGAYASAYSLLERAWDACPEVIGLFGADQALYVAALDETKIAFLAPQSLASKLRSMVQVDEVTSPELLDLASKLPATPGDPYVALAISLRPENVEEPALLTAPQAIRDEKAQRAALRKYFDKEGRPNFSDLTKMLTSFGVWSDPDCGKGSHGALFREDHSGRLRYTTCTSIREVGALPPRIIFDILKGLGISLQEFQDHLTQQ